MTFAFLAPSRSGWGEITLALRIAHRARAAGMTCRFYVADSVAHLVRQQGFDTRPVPEGQGGAFLEALGREVADCDGLVLVDLYLGGAGLAAHAVHPRSLGDLGPTLIGIDTWSFAELSGTVDVTETYSQPIEPTWLQLEHRIVPVPFARPQAPFATALLPEVAGDVPDRDELRHELGLEGPTVLVCSSWWQHAMFEARGCPRIDALLGRYLQDLGVTVLHVGPEPLQLGARRLDPMPADRFAGLLGAVDLVLSTNASATTNTAAISVGTPVLTVVNTSTAGSVNHLAFQFGAKPGPRVTEWTKGQLPLPRFFMWPMSMMRVLPPLLADNHYAERLHLTEVLDERTFHETARSLLFDADVRAAERVASAQYLDRVRALPGPVARLTSAASS